MCLLPIRAEGEPSARRRPFSVGTVNVYIRVEPDRRRWRSTRRCRRAWRIGADEAVEAARQLARGLEHDRDERLVLWRPAVLEGVSADDLKQ